MYIYTRNISIFTTEKYAIFEPMCKVIVQSAPLCLLMDLHMVTNLPRHMFVNIYSHSAVHGKAYWFCGLFVCFEQESTTVVNRLASAILGNILL